MDLGKSYSSTSGGGRCLPLVFLLHPGSFFLVLEHSASRTQQWGHIWSVQFPRVFWEAAAVGVAYKKLSWECCRQCCGLEESSSAFMVCMKGKSPAALVWTEIPGINRKGQERLLLLLLLEILGCWWFGVSFGLPQQPEQLKERHRRVCG